MTDDPAYLVLLTREDDWPPELHMAADNYEKAMNTALTLRDFKLSREIVLAHFEVLTAARDVFVRLVARYKMEGL